MNKKILVLDIDGTLVNSEKEITPKTFDALMQIQEMGHIVVLASGRPYPGMKNFVEKLKLEQYGGYVICFNGAKAIDCKTNEVMVQNVIPKEFAKTIYEYAKREDIGMVTYDGDKVIAATRIDDYLQYEARLNFMILHKVNDFLSYVDYDVPKFLLTAEPDKAKRCESELKELLAPDLNVFRSEPYFIEITSDSVDKAKTLDELIKKIGMKREDSICCGDGFNDLTMVQYAEVGVAMDNAQQIVKDNADYITASCDDDGIAQVIQKFILQI